MNQYFYRNLYFPETDPKEPVTKHLKDDIIISLNRTIKDLEFDKVNPIDEPKAKIDKIIKFVLSLSKLSIPCPESILIIL